MTHSADDKSARCSVCGAAPAYADCAGAPYADCFLKRVQELEAERVPPTLAPGLRADVVKRLRDLHLITCAADKKDSRHNETLPSLAADIIEADAERQSATLTPCNASGIYVASRVKQAEVWKAYRARGWKINSSWIDEAGEGETADFGELWERIRGEIARSHTLVFYAAGVEDFPFKGAFVEVGMALAMGKPVLVAIENVMLDGRTMRPVGSWLLDRKVQRFDSLEEAMDVARGVDLLCVAPTDDTTSKP